MSVDVVAAGGDPLHREVRESPSLKPAGPTPRLPNEELDVFSTLDIPGSEQFGKVMHDIQSKKLEQLRRLQEQLRAEQERQGGGADMQLNLQELKDLITEEEEEEEEAGEEDPSTKEAEIVLTPLQMTAQRAWGRIRRYVNDKAMKNRNQKSKMQWSMLKQTLSHMNNMERARADLYDRYLYNPESWTDGLTHVPENVFKKGRGYRHRATESTYVPAVVHGSVSSRSEASKTSKPPHKGGSKDASRKPKRKA